MALLELLAPLSAGKPTKTEPKQIQGLILRHLLYQMPLLELLALCWRCWRFVGAVGAHLALLALLALLAPLRVTRCFKIKHPFLT
jgi:hypothetical protein